MKDEAQLATALPQKKHHAPTGPLETRHVFLDTEVYHKLKHNPANRVLRLLTQHVVEHLNERQLARSLVLKLNGQY